jgi:hypothetical protein
VLKRDLARELAAAAMRVEQFASRVFEAAPTTVSRADDVAVIVLDQRPAMLAEATSGVAKPEMPSDTVGADHDWM